MDPTTISTFAAVLQATGPYGLVAVMGLAYWKLHTRKDQELKSMYGKLIELTEAQTAAVTKVEAALLALKEAIRELNGHRR